MSELALKNKRVLVTGAATGLGRAFAQAFAKAGAKVMVADINSQGVQETAALIAESGAHSSWSQVDVTSRASCEVLADKLQSEWGGVDVLVNNAAMYGGLERKPFPDLDEQVWDQVMAVNVKGVWQVTSAMTPLLKASGEGAVINVSSATVMSGSPQWLHYVASKGAVISMTRAMARELGDDNIRVNVIAPGFTLTEASLNLIDDAESYGVNRGALKRSADTDDMVGTALYLASPLAKFVTGQTLVVDGGREFN